MAKITIENANKMALWLAVHEPGIFHELLRRANAAHGALAGFGASNTLAPITVTASLEPMPSVSSGSSSGSSGGFWSSLGSDLTSGVSSLGSGIASGVKSVGSYLTSKQGLSSLTSLGALYLQSNAVVAQAGAAEAQANMQRTALAHGYPTGALSVPQQAFATQSALFRAGQSPAPISYSTNGYGQTVPRYYTGTTPSTLYGHAITTGQLSALAPSTISQYLPYILIGGGVLAVVLLVR